MMKSLMTIGMFVGYGLGSWLCSLVGLGWFSIPTLFISSAFALAGIWGVWKLTKDYLD